MDGEQIAWGLETSNISGEHVVTQSNELISAEQNLSLQERRIIYIFASLIRKNDDSFHPMKVNVKEIASILGIQEKNYYRKIKDLVVGLQQKGIRVQKSDSVLFVNWLSSSEYYTGKGYVELEFSPKMKPYLLQLQKHFTQFKLKNILTLNSSYSMRMYEILKQDEFRGTISYTKEKLRKLIALDPKKYTKNSHFKLRILDQAKKELAEKTDIMFDYEDIKEGRKAVGFKFNIEKNPKFIKKVIENFDNEEDVSQDIISLMISYGVTKTQSQRLLNEFGSERIGTNLEYVISRKNSIKNVAGAIVDAIKNNYAKSGENTDRENDSKDNKSGEENDGLSINAVIKKFIMEHQPKNPNKPSDKLPDWAIEKDFKKYINKYIDLSMFLTDDEEVWENNKKEICEGINQNRGKIRVKH